MERRARQPLCFAGFCSVLWSLVGGLVAYPLLWVPACLALRGRLLLRVFPRPARPRTRVPACLRVGSNIHSARTSPVPFPFLAGVSARCFLLRRRACRWALPLPAGAFGSAPLASGSGGVPGWVPARSSLAGGSFPGVARRNPSGYPRGPPCVPFPPFSLEYRRPGPGVFKFSFKAQSSV